MADIHTIAPRFAASLALLTCASACSDDQTSNQPDHTDASSLGASGETTGEPDAPDDSEPDATTSVDPYASEPPANPFLADSVWSSSHRTPWAQGSSPLPGPTTPGAARHLPAAGLPITLTFSSPYPDGQRTIWASPIGTAGAILKLDHQTFTPIDTYIPADREENPPTYELGISGAYNLLDVDNHFIVTRGRSLEVFGDEVSGRSDSPIALLKRYTLPDSFFCGTADSIVGITMLHNGDLALATAHGVVGTLPRQPEAMTDDQLVRFSINADACTSDPVNPDTPGFHIVSNSIAADHLNGIYIVSSQRMLRFQANDSTITLDWQATYNVGDTGSGIRLGAGSGSTPSLMGLPTDPDRFVVITDAQDVMHLVLFWRDNIPDDWTPLSPNHDPRIACEIPVTFGDPDAAFTLSEQSVLVRGYAAVVVNNLIADESVLQAFSGPIRNILSAIESGRPSQAPFGIERIDWDPITRTCSTIWVNPDTSMPNTIPTMSAATNLMYGVGLLEGAWGLHALDFDTGEARFFAPARTDSCDQSFLDALGPTFSALLTTWIEELPQLCENTTFAATQVGPDNSIYAGTFFGITRYD